MAQLTPKALEMMGFNELSPLQPITAEFRLIHVGRIQGFNLPTDDVICSPDISEFSLPCTVSLGNSLNAIAQRRLDDDFAEDESTWRNEHQAHPPFVVTIFGPTSAHTATAGWWKKYDESRITTFQTFRDAKDELKELCGRAIPQIYSALTIRYGCRQHPVSLNPIETIIVGRTTTGATIHDLSLEVSAPRLTVSSSIAPSELEQLTAEAIEGIGDADGRALEFFYSGETEEDEVKRFLHYFVALEILTHRAFKRTDESSTDVLSCVLPANIQAHGTELLRRQYNELKTLVDRFVWCAATTWSHVTDDDAEKFKRLKKIRDDIAHGNLGPMNQSDVDSARTLVLHVLRGGSPRESGV